jgi:CRP-like cAMP-binding protein
MDLSAKLYVLRENPYVASLPPAEARQLVARLRECHYRVGDPIFRKGDRCEGLFIVLSGRVRTSITSVDGREQVLKVFGPGRTFADIPVFDDEPLPADAVAVADSTVAILSQTDLLDLLRRHPDVSLDVIRLFASRLRAYKLVVEDLSLRDVVGRVARLLRDRARGQATLVEDSASASLRYTQNEIAAMVGSVREVVQRALKALEHAGVIQMARGRIRILDVEALRVWIDSGRVVGGSSVTGTRLANHSGRRRSPTVAVRSLGHV